MKNASGKRDAQGAKEIEKKQKKENEH